MAEQTGKLTLWGIEVFLATAEEGAVSAAARRLGSSNSSVSQQLSNLEATLGTSLLDRSTRPVRLTPAGEVLRRRAQTILREAQEARAELASLDISRLPRFRLGMIEDFDADVTPRLLSAMADQLSQCQFQLETGPSHRLFDLLDTRALDVAVATDMGPAPEWMEVHPLLEEPFIAAAPKGAIANPRRLDAFRALPLIQYTTRHYMGRMIAAHLARQDLPLAHRFELDSYHAIMAMVAAGTGWTILTPLGVLHAQRFRGAVDLLPLPLPPLSRTISLNARRGVLQDMPLQTAKHLRRLLAEHVTNPILADYPWLNGVLKPLPA
jgi:DNA-binding transcriptional LysR family regulator